MGVTFGGVPCVETRVAGNWRARTLLESRFDVIVSGPWRPECSSRAGRVPVANSLRTSNPTLAPRAANVERQVERYAAISEGFPVARFGNAVRYFGQKIT